MKRRLIPPLVQRAQLRRRAVSAGHSVVLDATAHLPVAVPRACPMCGAGPHFWGDLRRGRRAIWGSLLSWIDRAIAIGAPVEVLLRIPEVLEAYIRDAVDPTPPRPLAVVFAHSA